METSGTSEVILRKGGDETEVPEARQAEEVRGRK